MEEDKTFKTVDVVGIDGKTFEETIAEFPEQYRETAVRLVIINLAAHGALNDNNGNKAK